MIHQPQLNVRVSTLYVGMYIRGSILYREHTYDKVEADSDSVAAFVLHCQLQNSKPWLESADIEIQRIWACIGNIGKRSGELVVLHNIIIGINHEWY